MASSILLSIDRDRISVAPGASVEFVVKVQNLTTLLDHKRVRTGVFTFEGDSWFAALPSVLESSFFAAMPKISSVTWVATGATGVGVRLLYHFCTDWA